MPSIPISLPQYSKREKRLVQEVLDSGLVTQGKFVKKLEQTFSKLIKAKYTLACNNGTSALHLALHGIGINPGDEVITTPFTFIATVNSILMTGAKPILVDINENDFCINPDLIEKAITKRTKAILVVDLYGQPADYSKIIKIANKYKLLIIEDAAQSIGAKYRNKYTGNLVDTATFSLYATKNINCAEGGLVTFKNKAHYEKAKLFRHHGQNEKQRYVYHGLGYNYRLTDIQAAIAYSQLASLNTITKIRTRNAKVYNKSFNKIKGIITPKIMLGRTHVFHQYTIRLTAKFRTDRDHFLRFLDKKGIGYGMYYPEPVHLAPHIKAFGYKKGDFPISEKLAKQVLSLPIYPKLGNKKLKYIIHSIIDYAKSKQ